MDAGTVSIPLTASAEDEESVPFRPENRMTTFLVGAVLLLCLMAVWCVKVISSSPNPNSTPAWAFAGASILISFKLLIGMLQTEFTRRDIRADLSQTRHALRNDLNANSLKMDEVVRRTNGGLTHAVEAVGEQVRQAERDQVLHDADFRAKMAAELCPMLADDVAKRVAELLRKEPPPDGQI